MMFNLNGGGVQATVSFNLKGAKNSLSEFLIENIKFLLQAGFSACEGLTEFAPCLLPEATVGPALTPLLQFLEITSLCVQARRIPFFFFFAFAIPSTQVLFQLPTYHLSFVLL